MTQQERQGWFIVGSLFVTFLIVFGGGYDTVPVFIPTLVKSLGWSRAEVSLLPSALAFSAGASVLIVGWLLDRIEARIIMIAGAAMAGTSFLIASQAHSLSTMIAAYMLMGVAISAGTVIPGSFVIANWFVKRRGLAMGISNSGTTMGGMLMSLLASWVMLHWGWRAAFITLGVPMLVIAIPLVLIMVRSRPPGAVTMTVAEAAEQLEGFETAEAFRTRSFWLIIIAQFCFAAAATGTVIHMVAYLIEIGYKAGTAALVMSLMFGIATIGKITMGFLADRLTARTTLVLNFSVQTLVLVLALEANHLVVIGIFMLVFGLTFAAPLTLLPLLVAESLGLRRYGSLSGITSVSQTVGAMIGPIIAGRIFDVTHSYTAAFELMMVVNLLGAIVTFSCAPYERERSRMVTAAAAASA
jgi:MFS family permease